MCDLSINNIKSFYVGKDLNWQYKTFSSFYNDTEVQALMNLATATYPATHGKAHMKKVIENIDQLVNQTLVDKLDIKDIFNLLVAVIIHDFAMIHMIHHGNYTTNAIETRKKHSNINEIRKISQDLLNRYYTDDRVEYILHLASAHASDNEWTVEEKIEEFKTHLTHKNERVIWEILVRIICLVDYLDLGIERLIKQKKHLQWNVDQTEHLFKHSILKQPLINKNNKSVTIELVRYDDVINKEKDITERLKVLTVYQKTIYELKDLIEKFNESIGSDEWSIFSSYENLIGEVFPLSQGINLHTLIFNRALDKFKKDKSNDTFIINMMGHSLFARFVDEEQGGNKERLNSEIFKILEKETVVFRTLLLDPETEIQQSCEVYESQVKIEDNSRFILPLLDKENKIDNNNKGDILESLAHIKDNWIRKINEKSLFELKVTKRILYNSITRYGDYMVVTPYTKGLFLQSMNFVFSKESPLFDVFLKDFEDLWDKKDEARLHFYRKGEKYRDTNPIKRIIPFEENVKDISNFNYEIWLLQNHQQRINYWLKNDKIIPPIEIEIQPINYCNLKCSYCIGRYLDYYDLEKKHLKESDIPEISKLMEWEEESFRIERIRISGLNGDPLSDDALSFTKALINKNYSEWKKEIVLFTNGVNIDKALDELSKVDIIHVSLDAGNSNTFLKIKGYDKFELVKDNIRELRAKIRESKSNAKIGIGYVATQSNCDFSEIEKLLEFAIKDDVRVDFIRFKRDIHMPNSIFWRTWTELKEKIKHKKDENLPINIYITDMPRQHWGSTTKNCISDRFCLTVGADGSIYTCDHLANNPKLRIGKISNLKIHELTRNIKNRQHFKDLKTCSQCPPFNFRFNNFMSQLKSIYKNNPEEFIHSSQDFS